LGCVSVAGDLKIVFQLFVANCASLAEQCFDLTENQGIPFECRGAVRFLVPNLRPDIFSFDRQRQAAVALA